MSSASSSGVSRSMRSVAKARSWSSIATRLLRELKRLLPLPCANRTTARAWRGILKSPSSVTRPVETLTARSSTARVGADRVIVTSPSLSSRCRSRRRALEEIVHLLVFRLPKVLVPEPNRVEGLWRLETDDFVGELRDCGARLRGAYRYGDDDFPRTLCA